MNYSAYLATGRIIALMQNLSRINVRIHDQNKIPTGSIIFVVNHFTRIETLLLPYHIYNLTHVPVWSLAHHTLLEGPMSSYMEKAGAVSTRNPDRDRLIVKTLLTGETNWIIFPEGRMVKDKSASTRPPIFSLRRSKRRSAHTGAANLALRTEFYRMRLRHLLTENPVEAKRLQDMFEIKNLAPVLNGKTWIVPINLTYYPLKARENVLSTLANHFNNNISEKLREELLTEGTMLFEGVDIDIRIGEAIPVSELLTSSLIKKDMYSKRPFNFDDKLPSLPEMREKATNLMHRFMDDIYKMTTINHDHLFASLLRALPFNKISEADFRRRVFLLTDLVPEKALVSCHQSLEFGQVALLTDDRYHKYRDFLEQARESGVIRVENGFLLRNSTNLSGEREFQRVRIENPLGVAANEVKSLECLKHRVRLLAWLPEMLIRHRVAEVLQRQADEQFEADYRQFHHSVESKERSIGAPFLLKGSSRRLGIVLMHGFLATPREVLELAKFVHDKGFWVYCVRLRGHGTSPEDLATRNGDDWIESVDLGYALLKSICKQVVVGGFSLGGGLALNAAVRLSDLAGVFAVSPPFRLLSLPSRLASAVTTWNRAMNTIHWHGATKEYVDNSSERPLINYQRIPIAALAEMEHFMSDLEQQLPEIKIPTLIVQGDHDPLVDSEGTAHIFNRIGSESKKYLPLDFSRHGIVSGEGSEHVHAAIAEFIAKI